MTNIQVTCPYCNANASLKTAKELFPNTLKTKDNYWVCDNYPTCDSYVSANFERKPRGPLTSPELRKLRVMCHERLDIFWEKEYVTREETYDWLAKAMDLDKKIAHISWFSIGKCKHLLLLLSKEIGPISFSKLSELDRKLVKGETSLEILSNKKNTKESLALATFSSTEVTTNLTFLEINLENLYSIVKTMEAYILSYSATIDDIKIVNHNKEVFTEGDFAIYKSGFIKKVHADLLLGKNKLNGVIL